MIGAGAVAPASVAGDAWRGSRGCVRTDAQDLATAISAPELALRLQALLTRVTF